MPPRKRTDRTKRTPPTSPTTSTVHGSAADQHHHLRHTGPTIGTRASASATPSKPPPAPVQPEPTSESPLAQKGPREKKLLAEVSPPGARTSFTTFVYVLLFLALLLLVWYVYGMVTLLGRLKEEVGWWGIIAGDSGGRARWEGLKGWRSGSDRKGWEGGANQGPGGGLDASLNGLADALGISPMQVASAVKPVIPQASLESIASRAEETGSSEAIRILFEDTTQNRRDKAGATGVVEESAEGLGKVAEEDVAEGGV